jgi:hypothetical protein
MPELSKLTKAQLIDLIHQQEEDKYAVLKEELGLPYNTDEEWIEYIQSISSACETCEKCEKYKEEIQSLHNNLRRCY